MQNALRPSRALRTGSRVTATVAVLIAVLASLLSVSAPAQAAPGAPGNLSASSNVSGIVPTFSWSPVTGAIDYEFQLSSTGDFSASPLERTVNTSFVPRTVLPSGAFTWRVRAVDASGAGAWAFSTSYQQSALPGPALVAPADGAVVVPPDGVASFTWAPVPGASEYDLWVSKDQDFVDNVQKATSRTAAYVLPELQVTGTYYWRVRAKVGNGVLTSWSQTRTYSVAQLPSATRVGPTHDENVQDSVFRWNPVAGAISYDVQVSTDDQFLTVTHEAFRVLGTTYARPETLNNDTYYWRVRARDASDNVQEWSQAAIWRFQRSWPDQPHLSYPEDLDRVGDPLYFEWSPVKHASRYQLQLSTDSTFQDPLFGRCDTTATTFTPRAGGDCYPGAEGTYYWRVVAWDDFAQPAPRTVDAQCPEEAGTDCELIEIRRFTYAPGLVQLQSPAHMATVDPPTLRWAPFAGASRYEVTVVNVANGNAHVRTTASTAYSLQTKLDAGTYRWAVAPITGDGRKGSSILPEDQRRFVVDTPPAATAGLPAVTAPLVGTFDRFPTLTWDPVVSATHYRVDIRKAGTLAWTRIDDTFVYPAGEDTSDQYLAPESYEWRVEAFAGATQLGTSPSVGRFTIAAFAAVTGHRAALSNAALDADVDTCDATLPDRCQNLRQSPVLSWDPHPDAGYYKIYVSADREMTNPISGFDGLNVHNTRWTSPQQFADSQAATAYYWLVVPCRANNKCAPKTQAAHAFNKQSNPVDLVSPGVSVASGNPLPVQTNAITFTWRDFLETNTTAQTGTSALTTKATLEARQYRIQVSRDVNFQTTVDDRQVDQMSYTAFDRTYPEGPLYWRVQAIDGSGNPLSWSPAHTFRKQSPVPAQAAPAADAAVNGAVTLRWQPLDFAARYEVEIYENNDTNASEVNRRASGLVRYPAFTPVDALPVRAAPYVWRVQRRDANDRPGGWSSWRRFTVQPSVAELVGPAPDAQVHPNWTTFTWRAVDGASRYRFERRATGSAATADLVETQALSYAPTQSIPTGQWQWRVLPVDAAGSIMVAESQRDSLWRTVRVLGSPQRTNDVVITGSPTVGSVLSSTVPTWDRNDVTTTYAWYVSGQPAAVSTTSSYVPTREDLGQRVTLRVTGTSPGYPATTFEGGAVTVAAGPAATTAGGVQVSGSARAGTTLTGTEVTWNEPGVLTTYQWLRDGNPIRDAVGTSYTVTTEDAGRDLVMEVTGQRNAYATAVVRSNVVRALPGSAPVPSALPVVTGVPRVGETLATTGGTWPGQPRLTYQWLRDGVPLPNETGPSYRVQVADAVRGISVQVTAATAGLDTGQATSAAVTVASLRSSTTVALSTSRALPGKKVKVTITVAVPENPSPTGTVRLYDGSKVLKTMNVGRGGTATFTWKKLKKGKHTVKAVYSGNTGTAGSTSKPVKLVVKR